MIPRRRCSALWLWMIACLALASRPCAALIFLSSGDPAHNASAPTGTLANSGWQWQNGSGFCASAIGPSALLTAAHLGVWTNNKVYFGGLEYHVVAASNVPNADITLFWVAGRLPDYGSIYRGDSEQSARLVFHGMGQVRGDPVYYTNLLSTQLRGWLWNGGSGRLRWGTNTVSYTSVGTTGDTNFLACFFQNRTGTDIITFSSGDSGGGAYIHDTDGSWKLAGVVSRVESQFRYAADGDTISAALFDQRGFYEQSDSSTWSMVATTSKPGTILLTSRVSVHAGWIDSTVALGPGSVSWPQLFSAATPDGPFVEVSAYAVDPVLHTITANAPAGNNQFFILKGVDHVGTVQLSGGKVVVSY